MTTSLPHFPPRDFPAMIPVNLAPSVHDHRISMRETQDAEKSAKQEAVSYLEQFAKDHGYAVAIF